MSCSSARRRVAAGLSTALLVLLAGCAGGDEAQPEPAASPTPSTLADLEASDDSGAAVPRLEFCGLVPTEAVVAALGAEPESGDARAPGDPADQEAAEPGPALQEVGCRWSAGATTARAWVFAQPVGQAQAERAVAEAEAREGCRAEPGAAYGDPSVLQRCGGDGPRVRYAGLLGDTWLTCELQGPGARARAEAWCVAVLDALSAAR